MGFAWEILLPLFSRVHTKPLVASFRYDALRKEVMIFTRTIRILDPVFSNVGFSNMFLHRIYMLTLFSSAYEALLALLRLYVLWEEVKIFLHAKFVF